MFKLIQVKLSFSIEIVSCQVESKSNVSLKSAQQGLKCITSVEGLLSVQFHVKQTSKKVHISFPLI